MHGLRTMDSGVIDTERESSLHVTNTTYSGLQEHRIIVYTDSPVAQLDIILLNDLFGTGLIILW
jgi:hypothetical protein